MVVARFFIQGVWGVWKGIWGQIFHFFEKFFFEISDLIIVFYIKFFIIFLYPFGSNNYFY